MLPTTIGRGARNVSERMALAFGEREYSLSELEALADGMAAVLEERGVGPVSR